MAFPNMEDAPRWKLEFEWMSVLSRSAFSLKSLRARACLSLRCCEDDAPDLMAFNWLQQWTNNMNITKTNVKYSTLMRFSIAFFGGIVFMSQYKNIQFDLVVVLT